MDAKALDENIPDRPEALYQERFAKRYPVIGNEISSPRVIQLETIAFLDGSRALLDLAKKRGKTDTGLRYSYGHEPVQDRAR